LPRVAVLPYNPLQKDITKVDLEGDFSLDFFFLVFILRMAYQGVRIGRAETLTANGEA
jgi:hypothetical protein